MEFAITAVESITPVGHSAEMTAASVRAGISRLSKSTDYFDVEGNSIVTASIDGISDEIDSVKCIREIAQICLENLLNKYLEKITLPKVDIHLIIGAASLSRPGPRYVEEPGNRVDYLVNVVQKRTPQKINVHIIPSGNSSVIQGFQVAKKIFANDPLALCIIGGFDSLLDSTTLDWFEESERLKSETFGRNQGFTPGEAVGFMIVESEPGLDSRKKKPLTCVLGVGIAKEPAPLLSDQPSTGEGLTLACKIALTESSYPPNNIEVVFCDLNGEFFRSKQWGYAELRCFGENNRIKALLQPAECFGDIGAASGAVLTNIAAIAFSRGLNKGCVMIFCSGDEGECGAVILKHCVVS